MQPLHIAINGWFLDRPGTGSGQYLHHLLTHLPRLPREVRLSLLIPADQAAHGRTALGQRDTATMPDPIANTVANTAADTVPLDLPPLPAALRKLWWEQIAVPHAARRLGADVLWAPYWAAPAWQPVPVCVTVHDLIPQLLPAYRGGLRHRLYTALVSWTARRAAAILTVSHASARDIVQHLRIPPARVHVVYHGPNQQIDAADALDVDPDPDGGSAQEQAETARTVRARYGLPARYFLYLGGFDIRKNVAATLQAYARYLALGGDPAVKLVLAGALPQADRPFSPDPRRLAAEAGVAEAVYFCGWVDEADKAAIYAGATGFIFPSLYEGFGMMVLEAMAAGTPVITSA